MINIRKDQIEEYEKWNWRSSYGYDMYHTVKEFRDGHQHWITFNDWLWEENC